MGSHTEVTRSAASRAERPIAVTGVPRGRRGRGKFIVWRTENQTQLVASDKSQQTGAIVCHTGIAQSDGGTWYKTRLMHFKTNKLRMTI